MSDLIIPLSVVYAGLAGTLLALLVAAAMNRWSPKVFFLLALRLAIGWHFLFEGLYKINSHMHGPSEAAKPFSSEPYFRVAPGPIGALMRKQFDDPQATINEKVKPAQPMDAAKFARLPVADQAAACPKAIADQLDGMAEAAAEAVRKAAKKAFDNVDADEGKAFTTIQKNEETALKDAKTDDEKAAVKKKFDGERKKAKDQSAETRETAPKRIENADAIAQTMIANAKAEYARWVYGADRRDAKVKFIANDVPESAPERLAHISRLREDLKAADERLKEDLGNGYNIDSKRVSELRQEVVTAESDLAKDANSFVAELKKDLGGGTTREEAAPVSAGQRMDKFTMWFLVVVGSMLMFGLFTRLSCVLAAGFLVMTYLAHPPFPWYPLPPNTEGNPVFINKNVIEALALLALACMPTGRWLGLDALVLRPLCRYKGECCESKTNAQKPGVRNL